MGLTRETRQSGTDYQLPRARGHVNRMDDAFADTSTTGDDADVSGAKAVPEEFVCSSDSMTAGV